MAHKLIVLEGIDGSGKTALTERLTERMRAAGRPCVSYDRVPDRPRPLTPEQKKWAHTVASVEESFSLFMTSLLQKSDHIRRILPESSVVMDRYLHSVLVHHLALGLPEDLALAETEGLRDADHTFLLSVREDLRMERVRRRPDATAEDLMPAGDCSTVLGRKRLWFERLIPTVVDTSNSLAVNTNELYELIGS